MDRRDKLGWSTRLKLCWAVLSKGVYDPKKYKTIHDQQQQEVCDQRRRELDATKRPRTDGPESEYGDQ